MEKLFLIIGTLLGISINSGHGQEPDLGFRAGVNIAKWSGADAGDTNFKPGYHVGGYGVFVYSKTLSFEPGIYLSTKGFQRTEPAFPSEFHHTNTSFYLDLPALARFQLPEGFNVFVGPQFSFLLANRFKTSAEDFAKVESSTEGLRRVDVGASFGLGYQLADGLNFQLGYDHGFSGLRESSLEKAYNRVLKLSIGYQLK